MRRALGKGLAQLMGEQAEPSSSEIAVSAIVPNTRQPRLAFNDASLEELAQSIREVGVVQPLIVRPISEGRYELIAGERRLRAAKLAGLATVPVVVRSAGSQASLELALIENIQREDIAPLDCAAAYKRLMDEFSLTQERIAERVGKSRPAVANSLRLLKLPEEVQQGLQEGLISEGHAKVILMAEGRMAQLGLYKVIVSKGLSVREAESLAHRKTPSQDSAVRTQKKASLKGPDTRALEEELSRFFGNPVTLERRGNGGLMNIAFYSDEDLQRILEVLGVGL